MLSLEPNESCRVPEPPTCVSATPSLNKLDTLSSCERVHVLDEDFELSGRECFSRNLFLLLETCM